MSRAHTDSLALPQLKTCEIDSERCYFVYNKLNLHPGIHIFISLPQPSEWTLDVFSPSQCLKIRREQKIQRQANPSHFIKFRKIGEIQKNSTEKHLMSERNRNFLKTQKSAEFAELSAELVNNSAE
jgi:hypothetical protein